MPVNGSATTWLTRNPTPMATTAALRAGSGSRLALNSAERAIELAEGERGLARGALRHGVAQQRPADTDLALRQIARQIRDTHRDLVWLHATQTMRKLADLGEPAALFAHAAGGDDELVEQHGDGYWERISVIFVFASASFAAASKV